MKNFVSFLFLMCLLQAPKQAFAEGASQAPAPVPAKSLSEELLDTVRLGEPPMHAFDLAKFKDLIQKGADVNARDKSGQSVLLNAVISHAYLADDHADKQPLLEAIRLLAQKKADVNVGSYLGITPLMHAVHRAHTGAFDHPVPKIKPVYDILFYQTDPKPDLNIKSVFGGTALSYLASWEELDQVKEAIQLGADIKAVDAFGDTVFAVAAMKGRGKAQLLNELLDLLPEKDRAAIVTQPNIAGSTPLMGAVRGANVEVVKLLLDQFHADPNVVNVGGESALSISQMYLTLPRLPADVVEKQKKIYELLVAAGAVMPSHPPKGSVSCVSNNEEPFGFDEIKKTIEQCKLTSLDDLVPLLPKTHLSNYMLSYRPRGIQKGDELHPRVISMGATGKSILAFTGDPKASGYNTLEMIELKENEPGPKRFELHEIDFSGKEPKYSDANPTKCLACHGSEPLPRWDTWYLRPGFYNSEQGSPWPKEKAFMDRFQSEVAHTGRYKNLLPPSDSPFLSSTGLWEAGHVNNSMLLYKPDAQFLEIQTDVLSSRIAKDERLKKYRFAIQAAVSCNDPISEYVPVSISSKLPRTFEDLLAENKRLDLEEFHARIDRQLRILQLEYPQGTYAQQFVDGVYNTGQSYETERMARLRYVIEGSTGETMHWSMVFSPDKETYVVPQLGRIERKFWREAFTSDDEIEKKLRSLIETEYEKLPYSSIDAIGFLRGDDYGPSSPNLDNKQICKLLKEASLKELAQ